MMLRLAGPCLGTVRRGPDARPWRDAGVSNIIGAVLVFALVVMTMVLVQVRFVPVWEEDREAEHMDVLAGELAAFAAELDRATSNRTTHALAASLILEASSGMTLGREAPVPSVLSVVPPEAGSGVSISSPRFTVFESGQEAFYGVVGPDDWIPLDKKDQEIEDVHALRALRLRVDLSEKRQHGDGDQVALRITDAQGEPVGRATVTLRMIKGPERALETRVFDAQDNEVSSEMGPLFHNNLELGYVYIDLLEQKFLFGAVAAAAQRPLTLHLVDEGLTADYVVVYDVQGPAGLSLPKGPKVGLELAPYVPAAMSSGSLQVEAKNQRLVEQRYILEHGAVLRVQDDGAAFVVGPKLRAVASGSTTVLAWTLPSLTGTSTSVTSAAGASLVAYPPDHRTNVKGWAGQVTVEIPTQHGEVWRAAIDRVLRHAGLVADDHYTITADAGSMRLMLEGTNPDPDADDIVLVLDHASTEVAVQAR